MKFLHKYSCVENPNRVEILLKKCKHILSNNKLKEHKKQNLSTNNNNKKIENDNKNIILFIYIVNLNIPRSTKKCHHLMQLYVGTWKWKITIKILIMIMIKKKNR